MPDEKMNIQWFPGHMTKAQRMIEANIKLVDIVCEIIDARIPISSRNPDIERLAGAKPRMLILNRCDQADPNVTALWKTEFKSQGMWVLETDCKTGKGVQGFSAAVRQVLKSQIEQWNAKGQTGRPVRAMVLGIPNVGKSSFINKLSRRRAAKASDKPGVTKGKQWITVDQGLQLLDTPGILWPRFDDPEIGENLAFTGAVRDDILDRETLASRLMVKLRDIEPDYIAKRYKFVPPKDAAGFELLEAAAQKRGFLISGGEYDLERMSVILLDEFRGGYLGRISLEKPEVMSKDADCAEIEQPGTEK